MKSGAVSAERTLPCLAETSYLRWARLRPTGVSSVRRETMTRTLGCRDRASRTSGRTIAGPASGSAASMAGRAIPASVTPMRPPGTRTNSPITAIPMSANPARRIPHPLWSLRGRTFGWPEPCGRAACAGLYVGGPTQWLLRYDMITLTNSENLSSALQRNYALFSRFRAGAALSASPRPCGAPGHATHQEFGGSQAKPHRPATGEYGKAYPLALRPFGKLRTGRLRTSVAEGGPLLR